MMTIEGMLSDTITGPLGWTLLHFTWQGATVAILLRGALPLLRGHSARVRYATASFALLLMLALPLVTLVHLSQPPQSAGIDETVTVATDSAPGVAPAEPSEAHSGTQLTVAPNASALDASMPLQDGVEYLFAHLLPWLVLAWLGGVLILSIRLLGGWRHAQRIRKHHMRPMPERWHEAMTRLARKMGVKSPVLLYESLLVEVPTVIGWLRPVILVPASALVGLSPWHLEALLAHELAHVRRHDYLVNLLQSATEILLFYHPATWWVSRQVRIERENDCDDRAVRATGDVLIYARALAEIESLRSSSSPAREQLVMAADGGSLLMRIRRLVAAPEQTRRSSPLLIAVAFAVTFFALTVGARTILSMNVEMPGQLAEGIMEPLAISAGNDSQPTPLATDQAPQSEVANLIARDETGNEDAEVRRVATAALGKHAGTVIVMEPRTGRVYTIVNQEWALRRGWNPASTIKLVTGLAGVEEKLVDPGARLRFSSKSIPLNLSEALAESNSDYFQFIGRRVGFELLMDYARRLGLGERTGINYSGELAGQLPTYQAGMDAGRLAAYGDRIRVTPIQLATLVSAIANGGTLVVPRVPEATQGASRGFETQVRQRLNIQQESLQQLANGMSAAVRYGTGKPAYDPALAVAGKTGTGFDQGTKLGLFASYAPVDNPRLVVVVALQGAEESGPVAASVAGEIYRALKHRS